MVVLLGATELMAFPLFALILISFELDHVGRMMSAVVGIVGSHAA